MHVARGHVQTRFNQLLATTDMRLLNEPLGVNLGYGFILMEKQSGRFKYYHSSCNCCGRYHEEPALITNRADFDSFLERSHESGILQWAITQIPNSDWVCVHVTNVTFYINRILQHPICCVGMCLSTYKLKFLDMVTYLALGVIYDRYLKAYGCDLQKGHFPYEYMDDLVNLDDRALSPQEALYSRLKNEGISD